VSENLRGHSGLRPLKCLCVRGALSTAYFGHYEDLRKFYALQESRLCSTVDQNRLNLDVWLCNSNVSHVLSFHESRASAINPATKLCRQNREA